MVVQAEELKLDSDVTPRAVRQWKKNARSRYLSLAQGKDKLLREIKRRQKMLERECVERYPDILPKDTLPKDTLPKDILPNGHFADRHLVERTFCRTDSMTSGLFAEKTFCRNDNLPKIEKF